MPEIIRDIQIVGEGNVAYHLANGFSANKEIHSIKIVSRQNLRSTIFNSISDKVSTDYIEQIDTDFPLTILAVADDAIPAVAGLLHNYQNLIVHTAGSVGIELLGDLNFTNYGSFYPLQTFSLRKGINWAEIPIFINANSGKNKDDLIRIANLLSNKVEVITDDQRLSIHIGAVFVNNFANHLFALSDLWLSKNNLNFEIMLPLLNETIEKVKTISPFDAQTGPAIRSDLSVINKHLEQLKSDEQLNEVYRLLTDSIRRYHMKS